MMAKVIDIRKITPRTNGTRKLSAIKHIARHHSATTTGSWESFWPFWNKTKGWGTGGYHEIILRNGDVQLCYDPEEITNGVANHNSSTYHICVVGDGSFTEAQEKTFDERCKLAMKRFGLSADDVLGHREFKGASTDCPGINMDMIRNRLRNTVASTQGPAKEDHDDLKFTSGTLRKEFETFTGSKAQREIVVNAAVKAGYSDNWVDKLEAGKVEVGDLVMLGLGTIIRENK